MLNLKKMVSALLSVTMVANMALSMPAFADEATGCTYAYDGYEITYDVTNSWGVTEKVSITLSNTGDETIENWMLYFDPNGEITGLFDAQQATTSYGTTYYRNSGYNADVAPNASVTFSYTVDNCEEIPSDFTLCQTRADKTEGYSVSLRVNQTWGDNNEYFNGEIILENTTDEPIEAWELMVDTNFTITEITNSWAATVTELEPYNYLLKGTYTGTVAANSNVSLGFIGVRDGEAEIINYSLTESVVDEKLIKTTLSCFKNCDILDSDNDGLLDCIELEIGTDPFNPDTDDDGLSDGDELYVSGTDPCNPDTDNDELLDSDEGYNSNFYTDYGVYFDPFNYDTDGNGVADGKELINQTVDVPISIENSIFAEISVDSDSSNNLESCLEINSAVISDPLAAEAVGLVGEPIEISVPDDVSYEGTADITLKLKQQSIDGIDGEDMLLLYHDQESDQLYELETYYNSSDFTIAASLPSLESNLLLVEADTWHNIYKSSKIFDSSSYEIINDTAMTWAQSKEYCENKGGHLVTISSEEEQIYLLGLMSQYGKNYTYWLGYRYIDEYEGIDPHWESINGEGMPYTNWAPKEPNALYNEAVAHMYNIVPSIALELGAIRGQWNDTLDEQDFNPEYSYLNSGIICEYDSTLDSDEDGIPNILETAGMVTKNGKVIYTDPNNPDTDGDSIIDGQEMIMECKVDKRTAYLNLGQEYLFDDPSNYTLMPNGKIKGEVSFTYFDYESDPTIDDTSLLNIANVSVIPDIKEGQVVSIQGLITSNYNITSVTVGVFSSENGGQAYTSASATPNKSSYNISALDNDILFNKIPGGNTCYFRVVAKDSSGNELTLVNQKFIVSSKSNLAIKDEVKIPDINQGKPVSIFGEITSDYNITSVIVGVYSSEQGGTAYTSKSATPNQKTFNISALDNYILFNKVPGTEEGNPCYFRVVASDSSGNTKTLVNQKFFVFGNSNDDLKSRIKNSSVISQYGDDKIDSCVATAEVMLNAGFEPEFVIGMLANICHEGNVGLFEYYNPSMDYMQYMNENYSYKSKYSGKYIYNVNLDDVYNMLNQLNNQSNGSWKIGNSRVGFGLGSIQWTFGRTYNLVNIYREVNNNNSTITKSQATKAEGVMIMRELNGAYNYVYSGWSNNGGSVYQAAYNICVKYEVPANADTEGKERGTLAQEIYNEVMG